MESQCLQIDMDRHVTFSDDLLRFIWSLSIRFWRGSKESLWKDCRVLSEAHVYKSVIICFRILCNNSNEQMVESVYNDSMARFYSRFCFCYDSRKRWTRQTHETNYYEVCMKIIQKKKISRLKNKQQYNEQWEIVVWKNEHFRCSLGFQYNRNFSWSPRSINPMYPCNFLCIRGCCMWKDRLRHF